MAVLPVVKYGQKVLREKARKVDQVDDEIRQLISDMKASMYAEEGVGLAAEQVGRDEALLIIDVPAEEACGVPMPLVVMNPEILATDGEQYGQEGCLSFPGIFIKVKRAEYVKVKYLGEDGQMHEVEATGLLSRALQHEIDHLNGVLLVDKMTPVQKVANAGKLKRLKAEAA